MRGPRSGCSSHQCTLPLSVLQIDYNMWPFSSSATVTHWQVSGDRLTYAAALSLGLAYCTVVCDCTRPRRVGRALSILPLSAHAQLCWPRFEVPSPGAQGFYGICTPATLPAWLEATSPAPQLCCTANIFFCVCAAPRLEGSSPGAWPPPTLLHLSGLGILPDTVCSSLPAPAPLAACPLKPLQVLCLVGCLFLALCAAHVTAKAACQWHSAPQSYYLPR